MILNDRNKIRKLLDYFNEVKDSSFMSLKNPNDFNKVKETCRILDTFKLPLYYMWEQYCNQQLNDIGFEDFLRKPYLKFLKKPKTYTWEMLVFLTLCAPYLLPLKVNKISEISEMYNELLKDESVSSNVRKT